eukprot:CAMPEP_0194420236 /NCGR_PEP_ID=MMETSP0176-20130528/19488_1 /TAXON_ID=216777 /ORGANISM="Proboscia alata, Strain PI-D3" /LENGTH=128 /DNA_ID=CAMNT_0039227711 /DNA_START=115 /DNA_END=498 /DNA_ORIENTATION=+
MMPSCISYYTPTDSRQISDFATLVPPSIHRIESASYHDCDGRLSMEKENYLQSLLKSAPLIPHLDNESSIEDENINKFHPIDKRCDALQESGLRPRLLRLPPRTRSFHEYGNEVTLIPHLDNESSIED